MTRRSLSDFEPIPDLPLQYPWPFVEKHRVLKLAETPHSVTVGAPAEPDAKLRLQLDAFHNKKLHLVRIDESEFVGFLSRKLGALGDGDGTLASIEGSSRLDELANDAPTVNLVNSILIEAIRQGVSDVHIEAGRSGGAVRYRVDGRLRTVSTISLRQIRGVVSRVKIMANLNIMESRRPQDGRISVDLGGRKVDIRVSVVPVIAGESIVLRLLGLSDASLTLDALGMSSDALVRLRRSYEVKHGLILVTGPTGSGKTTTLNAVMQEVRTEELKAVSIEDPVEYLIPGVDQIQTNDGIGLTFEVLLARVLRQDPDIIMVGEIRDPGTAQLAVRASLTGHLVLATVHTNDAVSAVARLRNLGVEPYLIAAVLRAVVGQRLVRRLCPTCAQDVAITEADRAIFDHYRVAAEILHRPSGCPSCDHLGFRGRVGIFELFEVDAGVEKRIAESSRADVLMEEIARQQFVTMAEDGVKKAAAGLTSLAEVGEAVRL